MAYTRSFALLRKNGTWYGPFKNVGGNDWTADIKMNPLPEKYNAFIEKCSEHADSAILDQSQVVEMFA